LSWPEKHRPIIGRAKAVRAAVVSRSNRREHRLATILWDGSELVFAPAAFAGLAITQALSLTSRAPIAGGWQHHGILMVMPGLIAW
jgi:hypothetical protein